MKPIATGAPLNGPYKLSVAFLSHVHSGRRSQWSLMCVLPLRTIPTLGLHMRNVGNYINVHPVPGADNRRLCSCREPMVCSLHTSRGSSLLSLVTRDAGACIVSFSSPVRPRPTDGHGSCKRRHGQGTHPWRRCCATKTLRKAQRRGRVCGGSGHLPDRSHPPSQLQLPAPSLT